jgi:RNA polymerase sigma factor (sigma-70 family)
MNESDSVLEWLRRVRDDGLRSPRGRAAAESVVRVLGPYVMRLCLHRTDGRLADADDLFQETFVGLFEQAMKGNTPRSVGAYVATITRRRAHARYQRREQLHDGVLEPEVPVESFEDYIVDRIDLHALASLLPAAMRRVVLGTIVDGASSKALAAELETSEENVRQLRSRAVAMIAELRGI